MVVASNKDNKVILLLLGVGVVSSFMAVGVQSFAPSSCSVTSSSRFLPSSSVNEACTAHPIFHQKSASSTLLAAESGEGGGKKKRRRKRKKSPASESATTTSAPEPEGLGGVDDDEEEINIDEIKELASYSFDGPPVIDAAPPRSVDESAVPGADGSIPLPDIKDTMRRKEMAVSTGSVGDNDDMMPKTKIDRNDRKALLKLLEQDPYADGDDSFFEEQEYTTVSALLGERAKPFLGIPTGPLQVGHFIGALVIVLMAFIEYPGFPLTNLPSPVRGALQGGLGTVYGINILLAGVAAIKAGERGQPAPLWIAKTFTVGGLALDQLTQLPTTEQVEAAKARKGKRALKNRRK